MCLTCVSASQSNDITSQKQIISNENSISTDDAVNAAQVNKDTYTNTKDNSENNVMSQDINRKTEDNCCRTSDTTGNTTTSAKSDIPVKEEINIKTSDGNKVIYVSTKGDDNNVGSKNNPKKSIKNALETASNYGTIYLSSGTYLEHGILINKNITIVGENPKTTIINAQSKHLFTIAPNTRVSIQLLSIKNTFDDNGGAICNKGDLSLKHVRLYSNQARNGGAIYNMGKLYTFKSFFTANSAKYGSCIYNTNSLEANKCVFTSNKASQFAAIYSNSYMNLISCNFTSNVNSSILIEKSTKQSSISSCLFTDNNAVHGAGIYNKESPLEVKNTYFEKNTATNYGAAIYTTGKTSIKDCKFKSNKAYNGGAVANKNVTTITTSTFESNTATNEGAGVYNSLELKVTDSTFKTNKAKNGGAISSTSNTKKELDIDSSTFLSNNAQLHGSAIYVTNKNQLVLKDSLISYNNNESVYVRCDGDILNTIHNCNLTKNRGSAGSAVFNHKSVLRITKSIIDKNNNTIKGAIYNNHGKTTVNYCIIGENNKIDIANYNGSVNANYNWWLKNSVDSQNANGFTVNNWIYFKMDSSTYEINKTGTTTIRIDRVYDGTSFTSIDATNLPSFTFTININGGGISKNITKTVTNGVCSENIIFTKEGDVTITAFTYNTKLTEKFTLKSNLIKSKITSYFVQIGYDVTKSMVNSWINVGVTDVYVQVRVSTSDTANLRNVATLCKNTPIRVHAWVICFENDDVSESRQNAVKSFISNVIKINGVNGVCLDYVRYSGLRLNLVDSNKITQFVKSVNTLIKGYDRTLLLSACVFAEKAATVTYYGQNYLELSRYLDVMLPMTYKYEYNAGREWLKSSTEYVVSHAKYCKVVSVLQTYDKSLSRLSQAELEADARAVMSVGSYGYSLFRCGLISTYPKSAVNL
ncbi:MAG: hypothetical protein BZ137_07285 [Methanosphaera sp. rholeuAM130]|nr:MAG: hypothetical protein BZ137_07285 [Methanosphaera sp. rholeuAM130]